MSVLVRNCEKLPTLLCCLENTAFTLVSNLIIADAATTYDQAKDVLKTRFCGEEYKRILQVKLQSLKFVKGMNINSFIDELMCTIKNLYSLDDVETVKNIALNHITSNLDDSLRYDAKIFQLSGNKSLENLLEFVSTKLCSLSLRTDSNISACYSKYPVQNSDHTRLDKLESIMERVLNKLDKKEEDYPSDFQKRKQICNFCNKTGHVEERCFKKKICHKCDQKGHIAKFCKVKPDGAAVKTSSSAAENKSGIDLAEPAQRTVISVKIGTQNVDFLYDTGLQASIMTRESFDNLVLKPPLQNIDKSGTAIDGSLFQFDGIAYLNLIFPNEEGNPYTLEYEPILVSSKVTRNIFGAKTENRFRACIRDLENSTITYTPKDSDTPVALKCYKEKINNTSAFIQVAKMSFVKENEIKLIKAHVMDHKDVSKRGSHQ